MRDLQSNINDRGEIKEILYKIESLKTAIDLKSESEALTPEDRSRLMSAKHDLTYAIDSVRKAKKDLEAEEELYFVYVKDHESVDECTKLGYIYAETIYKAFQELELIGSGTREFHKIRGESEAEFYAGSIYMKIEKYAGIHAELLDNYEDLGETAINETKAYDDYINGK